MIKSFYEVFPEATRYALMAEEYNAILDVLVNADKPLRAGEIANILKCNGVSVGRIRYGWSCALVTAYLTRMKKYGVARRTVTEGAPITVKSWDWIYDDGKPNEIWVDGVKYERMGRGGHCGYVDKTIIPKIARYEIIK